MFIVSKRNIILPSKDGKRAFRVDRDYIGEIPEWAADTDYFRALAADGKIGVPEGHSDGALEAADKKSRRGRKDRQDAEAQSETGDEAGGGAEAEGSAGCTE